MAMSQFSYGAMKVSMLKKQQLPVPGGYDKKGRLTRQPEEILASERTLPIGYWKGAGLSLLLDLLATVLTGGISTSEISQREHEYGMSQVYIAIDIAKLQNHQYIIQTVNSIIDDYLESKPIDAEDEIFYPGKRVLQTRKENKIKGIPVIKSVWDEILEL
jgi:3-dehydro-L-gulonate 2-dehydrogenase